MLPPLSSVRINKAGFCGGSFNTLKLPYLQTTEFLAKNKNHNNSPLLSFPDLRPGGWSKLEDAVAGYCIVPLIEFCFSVSVQQT